jgi:hypothetical protein
MMLSIICGVHDRLPAASAIESDIVSAEQHGAVGINLSSVQLLGSPEFYQLPMRVKYSSKRWLGKITRLSRILESIDRDDA